MNSFLTKLTFLFLAFLFLTGAFFLERNEKGWSLESHFIMFLARVTHHQVLSVTAVKMPLVQSLLSHQDVALALRAIVDFHPKQVLVMEGIDDVSSKPFSILREAIMTGELQGVTVRFLSKEPPSSRNQQDAVNVRLISFEDLLLHREERERGSIVPELDVLFSGKTVLLGGPQIREQALTFTNQIEKKIVMLLPWQVKIVMLLLLFLFIFWVISFSWIDFLLFLVGFVFCFVVINAWLFQARGVVLPLITPCMVIVISFFGKLLSCTSNVKK